MSSARRRRPPLRSRNPSGAGRSGSSARPSLRPGSPSQTSSSPMALSRPSIRAAGTHHSSDPTGAPQRLSALDRPPEAYPSGPCQRCGLAGPPILHPHVIVRRDICASRRRPLERHPAAQSHVRSTIGRSPSGRLRVALADVGRSAWRRPVVVSCIPHPHPFGHFGRLPRPAPLVGGRRPRPLRRALPSHERGRYLPLHRHPPRHPPVGSQAPLRSCQDDRSTASAVTPRRMHIQTICGVYFAPRRH